jgi:hypothetical protein
MHEGQGRAPEKEYHVGKNSKKYTPGSNLTAMSPEQA